MKITIDTKEDSHEDITKVMQILQHFTSNSTKLEENSALVAPIQDTSSMMSMFGDIPNATPTISNTSHSEIAAPQIQSAPDFTSFLNLTKQNQELEKKEEHKIELF